MPEERVHFLVLMENSDYRPMLDCILKDFQNRDDVTFLAESEKTKKVTDFLKRRRVCKYLHGSFDFLGYEKGELYKTIKKYSSLADRVVVLFLNGSLQYHGYLDYTLRRYKKQFSNLYYVLYYLDSMQMLASRNADWLLHRNVFDRVYTIDPEDARKAGAHYWNTIYSKDDHYKKIAVKKHLYFCGLPKGRIELLQACAEKMVKHHIEGNFELIDYDRQKPEYDSTGILKIYTQEKFIRYPTMLAKELEAKCVLDIVQPGQSALSLRAYEAVCYNRKLLTNNKTILSFKFYDSRFMQYFEKVEDIDWNWVKEDIEVDYHYNGEFSPLRLMEDIIKSCEEK